MPRALLPSNEIDRLKALHSYRILDTDCEDAFDNLARLAARLTNCPIALVSLVDEKRQWFKARHGLDATETHRDLAFCAHAISDPSQVLVVQDATTDTRFADNPLVTDDPGIRFYAGMPLVNPEGYALGTLCIIDYEPKDIRQEDLETLSHLAQAVMSTLELRRIIETVRVMANSAEDRFARVFEALPTALVLCERDGKVRLINQETEHVFGYDRTKLEGQSLGLLLPESFRHLLADPCQDFMTNMAFRIADNGRALFGRREDGSEFPMEIGLNPIDFDNESMVVAGITDITTRHEIEREKEQQRIELKRSNADLEEFAYAASHDLKAPLRAISHLVQWIHEDIAATASSETLENLSLLQGRATRLQMLLDGLLAYSRIGHTLAAVEDVDIADVVRDVVAMLSPAPGFVIDCKGAMAKIHTHRMPIRVVLENLIGNALKHHDRKEGRITINVHKVDDMTEFRITDDGPGIDARFHDRVFVIFQTLSGRDDVESNGIGLAIVKKKVQAHGGRIWIESAPPIRGTTFAFTWQDTAR